MICQKCIFFKKWAFIKDRPKILTKDGKCYRKTHYENKLVEVNTNDTCEKFEERIE